MTLTPKRFYQLTILYVIILLPLGFWLAKSIIVFVTLIFLLSSIYIIRLYLKPPIHPEFISLFWVNCFLVIMLFILTDFGGIKDKYVENKSQLEQYSGIVPKTFMQTRGRHSTNYLGIGLKGFHCENHANDTCNKIYAYHGQKATLWYQPDTSSGNLVYEIQINGKKIYDFDSQRALFLQEKSKQTRQWSWTFLLVFLPNLWLAWQNRKIRKTLPQMTDEQVAELNKNIQENTEPVGCLGLIGVTFFMITCIASGVFAWRMFIKGDIATAVLLSVTSIVSAFLTYFCAKPSKKSPNS